MRLVLNLHPADVALVNSFELPAWSGASDLDVPSAGAWSTSLGIIRDIEVRNAGPPRARRDGRGREEGSVAA